MRKWLTVAASLFMLIALVSSTFVLADTPDLGDELNESDTYQGEETTIVRVYYSDRDMADKIIISFENLVLETNYDQNYTVMEVTKEELKLLTAAGLHVEVDTEWDWSSLQHQEPGWPSVTQDQTIPGYPCYRTVEGTFSFAQRMVDTYPDLAAWTDRGNSWEKSAGQGGYDMMVLILTNKNISGNKPKFFATCAIHAREYTTAPLCVRFAEQLLTGYGSDADATWILDYHEVHLMLHANPDGRKKAEGGASWRKNTNQNYCGATSSNRGADLNRNFSYRWGCCGGSSGNECDSTYRGPYAASEPEVQAVQNYARSIFPDQKGPNPSDPAPADATGVYIDFHASGRLVLWPWGYTSTVPPNGTALQTLGRKMAYWNGHTPEQAIGLYPTDGTTDDFVYGDLGVAAYTFELGTTFFQSCSYFESTIVPDNLPSMVYAAKTARTPYLTPAGPDAYNLSLSQDNVPAGTPVTLDASISDTRYNNSNGTEPTQNVAAAEYYIDTPPWVGGAQAISMSASDGSFNEKVEDAEATVNTGGLSAGKHILFVRGRDANGNWGAFSAIFLTISGGPTPTPTPTGEPPTPTPTPTGEPPTPTPTPTSPPGNVVFFDDFESNQGWVVDPNGNDTATTGLWERANPETTEYSGVTYQLGTTVSGSYDLVTEGSAGSSVGSYDIDGGDTTVRSPNITLPSSGDVTLSFSYYLAHYSNATSDDYLRVKVVGSTTQTVFEELGAGNTDGAVWDTFSTSLNAFRGQTIYLLIEAADGGGGSLVEAAIDDVLIESSEVPPPTPTPTTEPPTPTPTGVPPTPTPTGVPPTPTPTSQPGVVFFDDFETSQVWTTNPFGDDAATTGLWERANPEGTEYSGVTYQLGTTVSGSYDLVTEGSAGSSVGSYDIDNGDTTIRSPDITLPSSGDITLSFSYYLAHYSNATSDDYLRVKVVGSTTQTVFEELGAGNTDGAVWDTFSTSLNDFRGQTVYLLIEAADGGGGSLIEAAIDDVLIASN